MNTQSIDVSVIVPISERHDDLKKLYKLYADKLKEYGKKFEFIFVVDGDFTVAYSDLLHMKKEDEPIQIIKFPKSFGESNALMEGFKASSGKTILTLASYIQVEPDDLEKVFQAYNQGYDLIVTRRYPRNDPKINRIQSHVYHYIVNSLTGTKFQDITSGVRVFKKEVLSEFNLYGDLHRFIPIMAFQKGLKVKEVRVRQRKEDTGVRVVRPGIYVRRILDILTLFFLLKFTKKPLRFFGLVGSSFLGVGLVMNAYLILMRIFGNTGLSNRPALLFGVLFIVFGIQTLSLGLVGELILFSHSKELENYKIEQIIQ